MIAFDAQVQVARLLSFVVALGALLPLYADVVLVDLVCRDAAVPLRSVFAVLVVTEPPGCPHASP